MSEPYLTIFNYRFWSINSKNCRVCKRKFNLNEKILVKSRKRKTNHFCLKCANETGILDHCKI